MEARLLQDHERIRPIAERLKTLLASAAPPETETLALARWAFASTLMRHLAMKERHIYSKLENDPRRDVRAYFVCSKADLLDRFDAYTRHMANWSTSDACSQWASYRVNATHVVNLFLARLQNEEQELFPYLRLHEIDITTPSPVSTNWTRQAFKMKDKAYDQ